MITDPLPQDLVEVFERLVARLDETIPPVISTATSSSQSGTFAHFGRVTEKWRSEQDDSPRRDLFDLRCIAEIVSRFDVVAIEEAPVKT